VSVFVLSLTTVAIAEIGDKTQLLSLVLASRYRKPIPIILAILFDEEEAYSGRSAFITSFIAFFIAEIGDKTQIATSILGAQYTNALLMVIIGTTLGMMLANVPVVLMGKVSAERCCFFAWRLVRRFITKMS